MSAQIVTPLPNGLCFGEELRIARTLGRGGFGITYLVEALRDVDTRIKQGHWLVAKEFARSDLVRRAGDGIRLTPQSQDARDAEAQWSYHFQQRDKVFGEARVLATLKHDNIVEVFMVRNANNTTYILMEFVDGQPLSRRIDMAMRSRGFGLSWPELHPIATNMLSALRVLGRKDIIHRDIKPDNVMLRESGQGVLIDFGAARDEAHAHGSMVFTPGHAGLEQILNFKNYASPRDQLMPISASTDIYGLAATFYSALTGRPPYETSKDFLEILHRQPLRNHELRTKLDLPDQIASAIDWALNFKDASARPQTADEWCAAFEQSVQNSEQSAKHYFAEAERLRRDQRDTHQMMALYESAASLGDHRALYRLGRLHWNGTVVSKDHTKAVTYFQRAADAGNGAACYRLAQIYLEGAQGAADVERAYLFARRAADAGFGAGANLVGRCYRKGIYVAKDNQAACDWYEVAVRAGDPNAAQNLASMYRRGLGRAKDTDMAAQLEHIASRLRAGESPNHLLSGKTRFAKTDDDRR